MIWDDVSLPADTARADSVVTLDDIFRVNVMRTPEAAALIDPLNRAAITGDAPRHLTYAQADRMIDGIAGLLRAMGLPEGSVVALQLPNVTDSVVALLAVIRAGMVPAPLPLLWRRSECVGALAAARARAIITCGRVDDCDHGQLALEIAAELFPIRLVCAFGSGLTDGIVPIDEMLAQAAPSAGLADSQPVAVITFDTGPDGPITVPRNHLQLLAAGRLIGQEAGLDEGAVLLSTIPAASFAGIAATILPWLLSGGTLVFHHPFEPAILKRQIAEHGCSAIVLPDAVLPAVRDDLTGVRSVIAVCRAPERLAAASQWTDAARTLVDVAAFGERALLARARALDGPAGHWPVGPVHVPEPSGQREIGHVAALKSGSLGIRGALALLPASADPADDAVSHPFPAANSGHIDTGYPCQPARDGMALTITAAPSGIANVGGYRFTIQPLQQAIRDLDSSGLIAALPHALCGHRLAGHANHSAQIRDTLQAFGLNPLVANAFRSDARNGSAGD